MKLFYFYSFICALLLSPLLADDSSLIITGIVEGSLTGGNPKALELYALKNISDLSSYGIGITSNGNGATGVDYTFASDSVTSGDFIYVVYNLAYFMEFFEISNISTFPYLVYSDVSQFTVNGDDTVELYYNSAVIDTYGNVNVDGTGKAWEYLDGWGYRKNNTGPDGSNFTINNWRYF